MKKIFYISTRYPFPVKSGREKMIEQTLRFLSEDFEIYLAYFSRFYLQENEELLKKYNIKKTFWLRFPNLMELGKNFFLRKNVSLQEKLFFSKKTQEAIKLILNNINPDIVIADMIRTAQYLEDIDIKKILDMDDLLSVRYKRYQKIEYKENKILGTFQDIIPSLVSNLIDGFLRNKVLDYESKKIKQREIELAQKFNAVLLVSPKEAKKLAELTELQKIYSFPPAIQIRENIYNINLQFNNFLFIGNMKTSQNLSSVKYIIEEIFPHLVNKIKFKFWIVGIYDERLVNLTKRYNKNIELLGFVKNLDDIIRNSKLLLSPIAFGTGIKTKILDAMSYGLPVVTNSVGIEGLNVKHLKECIINDNPKELANSIISVVNNKELLLKLSKEGYTYVMEYHNPQKLKNKLLYIVNNVLEDKQ